MAYIRKDGKWVVQESIPYVTSWQQIGDCYYVTWEEACEAMKNTKASCCKAELRVWDVSQESLESTSCLA